MKKYILIAMLVMMSFANLHAQDGEIIYRDFEPDSMLVLEHNWDTMLIDLDGEGYPDIMMYYYINSAAAVYPFIKSMYQDSLTLCVTEQNENISEVTDWHGNLDWRIVYVNTRYGFRRKLGDGYQYGWFETYTRRLESQPTIVHWGFDRMAYCTIPNYPLQWGQTSFSGVEEGDIPKAFATIHPNPANATLTITGENLKQIEITNMLGQRMATYQAEGSQTTIDISALPTGIYFVGITDENGKRCVQKVVKE